MRSSLTVVLAGMLLAGSASCDGKTPTEPSSSSAVTGRLPNTIPPADEMYVSPEGWIRTGMGEIFTFEPGAFKVRPLEIEPGRGSVYTVYNDRPSPPALVSMSMRYELTVDCSVPNLGGEGYYISWHFSDPGGAEVGKFNGNAGSPPIQPCQTGQGRAGRAILPSLLTEPIYGLAVQIETSDSHGNQRTLLKGRGPEGGVVTSATPINPVIMGPVPVNWILP